MSPKVKNFLWCVCRGYFPTGACLSNRCVSCSLDCVFCNSNYEDITHVPIECPKTFRTWRDVNLWDKIFDTFELMKCHKFLH